MERNTRQRDAIRRVIADAARPLGTAELLEAASKHVPGMGIATVYRAVKGLVEEGWLVAVDLPGQASRYEQAGKKHHDHFLCRTCARVFEIDDCAVRTPRLPKGFLLQGHEVILNGVCPRCR